MTMGIDAKKLAMEFAAENLEWILGYVASEHPAQQIASYIGRVTAEGPAPQEAEAVPDAAARGRWSLNTIVSTAFESVPSEVLFKGPAE